MTLAFHFGDETFSPFYIVQTTTVSRDGTEYWSETTKGYVVKAVNKIRIFPEKEHIYCDGHYSFRKEADAKLMAKTLADSHPSMQFRVVKIEPTVIISHGEEAA